MSPEMFRQLYAALDRAEADRHIRHSVPLDLFDALLAGIRATLRGNR